jgi:hypothetical protein
MSTRICECQADSLDQILIRVANVHRLQLPNSACSVHDFAPFQYLNGLRPQSSMNLIYGCVREETEVSRTRDWRLSLGLKFLARLVKINLLLAEDQGVAVLLSASSTA